MIRHILKAQQVHDFIHGLELGTRWNVTVLTEKGTESERLAECRRLGVNIRLLAVPRAPPDSKLRRLVTVEQNLTLIEPVFFRPAITSMRVVLPAPEEPMSAVMVPGRANPLIPFSKLMDSVGLLGLGTEYHRSLNATVTGTNALRGSWISIDTALLGDFDGVVRLPSFGVAAS